MDIRSHHLEPNRIRRPIFYVGKPSFKNLPRRDFSVFLTDMATTIAAYYSDTPNTKNKIA